MMVEAGQAGVYDFKDNVVPGSTERDRDYWRDVGTLDSYHEAHLDLVSVNPVFNLYNTDWPIFTSHPQLPGAKFVEDASARDTIVCAGSIVSGASVDSSVVGTHVYVSSGATVENSVLLDNVTVGAGCTVRNAILDKNVIIPDGVSVGVDPVQDRARGFTVSDGGVTVLGKGQLVIP
jgi:glucose-1-phosphate adenylyltransferase